MSTTETPSPTELKQMLESEAPRGVNESSSDEDASPKTTVALDNQQLCDLLNDESWRYQNILKTVEDGFYDWC